MQAESIKCHFEADSLWFFEVFQSLFAHLGLLDERGGVGGGCLGGLRLLHFVADERASGQGQQETEADDHRPEWHPQHETRISTPNNSTILSVHLSVKATPASKIWPIRRSISITNLSGSTLAFFFGFFRKSVFLSLLYAVRTTNLTYINFFGTKSHARSQLESFFRLKWVRLSEIHDLSCQECRKKFAENPSKVSENVRLIQLYLIHSRSESFGQSF